MIGFQSLASGSKANCMVLGDDSNAVLLDCGLGPRELTARLDSVGQMTGSIRSVVLTHTHTDHWTPASLRWLARNRVRVWCHEAHVDQITSRDAIDALTESGLLSHYREGKPFSPMPGWHYLPIPLSHDKEPTFGFRCDHGPWSMAYLADLGTASDLPWDSLTGIDFLAIESNHDPEMLRQSGRPHHLITRIAGNSGHLSNGQCAEAARNLAQKSQGRLSSVMLLHLSAECNSTRKALGSTRSALDGLVDPTRVLVAHQDEPGTRITGRAAA